MTDYARFVAAASADPGVLGMILTGSHARGTATVHSDHDVVLVAADGHEPRRTATLDVAVCTVEALADTSVLWPRYGFRGAKVLLDRLDGRIAELVSRQATPTPDEAAQWAREGLDGYVNFLYRAAKSRRDGDPVAARLDEAESVSWLLTTVFALHGRLRPYNKYLRWELETYPLAPPWDATLPERVAADPASLFPDVARLARDRGHGDVLDGWGDDLTLILP
ncbi:nucleotidyltransferase domain-containing protein [Nucisporomicrobium flavum]|uniref:nucleotidyltransferase domain-containing protein n=1 Tax=Nucisporomicrobium flavum TaxID=2785915 RepID=UPI0018F3E19A|nr:nucleotidyltransferase domain-containing protein [Nucisporomicrobium flavum]